ncbi:uncharacterized protein mRpS11 isoform X2 [Chelonus insularis]|uniref:uncharacterized protein mRpS11 isoform X2 n=1 Tax=Chelonus insularis TaxID=460826 RepID=UPI0015892E18|nr:uncharacterized protein LOC118063847 isoform X2 [Chelonus insularis]
MLRIISTLIRSPIVEPLCSRLNPSQFSNWRCLHLTYPQFRDPDKEMRRRLPKNRLAVEGEHVVDIDEVISKSNLFPDMHTPNKLFNGIPFKDVPVVTIKVSKNNTIMTLRDSKNMTKAQKSCGTEGYKNAKKGTNIAAQATGIAMATRALELGFKTIRVCVRGLGPGRMVNGISFSDVMLKEMRNSER